MSSRLYITLNVETKYILESVQTLKKFKNVVVVDILEDEPNLIICLEADNRSDLAQITNEVLKAVERLIISLRLLPVADDSEVVL